MDRLVPDEAARDVSHVRDVEFLVALQLIGWNIFNWHLWIGISVQLVDGDFFDVAFHLDSVDFAVRNSVVEGAKMFSIDGHQEFCFSDDDLDGEAVASEQVISR